MPIPQEKATQLVGEINSMIQHGVNEASLRSISEEADRLEEIDFISAKRVKGMVASLKFDRARVKTEFEEALACGWNPVVYSDYASALANMYDFVPAVEMIKNSLSISPGDVSLLNTALMLHLEAYNIDGSRSVIHELQKLGEMDGDSIVEYEHQLLAIAAILDGAGVTWQAVCERILLASESLIPYELALLRRVPVVDEDGISYYFILNASVDIASEAASKMLDAIADVPFSEVDRVISFSCVSAICQ